MTKIERKLTPQKRAKELVNESTQWIQKFSLGGEFTDHLLPEIVRQFRMPGVTAGQVEQYLSHALNMTEGELPNTTLLSGDTLGHIVGEAIIGLEQCAGSPENKETALQEKLIARPLETLYSLKEDGQHKNLPPSSKFTKKFFESLVAHIITSGIPHQIVNGLRILAEQPITLEGFNNIYDEIERNTIYSLPAELLPRALTYLKSIDQTVEGLLNEKYRPESTSDDWNINDSYVSIQAKKWHANGLIANKQYPDAVRIGHNANDRYETNLTQTLEQYIYEQLLTHCESMQLQTWIQRYQDDFIRPNSVNPNNLFTTTEENKKMLAVHAVELRADVGEKNVLQLYGDLVRTLKCWGDPLVVRWASTMMGNPENLLYALMEERQVSSLDFFPLKDDQEKRLFQIFNEFASKGVIPFDPQFISRLKELDVPNKIIQQAVVDKVEALLPDTQGKGKPVPKKRIGMAVDLVESDIVKELFTEYHHRNNLKMLKSSFENPDYLNLVDRIATHCSVQPVHRKWFSNGHGL